MLVLPPQSKQLPAYNLKAMPTMVTYEDANGISDPKGKQLDNSGYSCNANTLLLDQNMITMPTTLMTVKTLSLANRLLLSLPSNP
jgi:hypothetical protein